MLTGRPWKAKSYTKINSGVLTDSKMIIYPYCSSLEWNDLGMSHLLFGWIYGIAFVLNTGDIICETWK